MKRLALLTIALFCMTGCEAIVGIPFAEYMREDRIYTWEMAPNLQYDCFSVTRPTNKRWFIERRSEKPSHVEFDVYDSSKPKYYSFHAVVSVYSLGKEPKTKQEFLELVQTRFDTAGSERHECVKKVVKLSTRQGQWCVNYDVETWDKKAHGTDGKKVLMTLKGFVIKHPFWGGIVDACYSERGLPDDIRRADNVRAGDEFLKGIVIHTSPGKPVVGPSDE